MVHLKDIRQHNDDFGDDAVKTASKLESERRIVDDTLYFIAESGWENTEVDFFISLARHLAESLDVAYAMIGRLDPDDAKAVETIAFYASFWSNILRTTL